MEKILETVKGLIPQIKKGVYVAIEYIVPKKTSAKHKDDNVCKHTISTYRMGIPYGNMKEVKQMLQEQNREVGELPWGEWVAGYENYLIHHKGNYYLRLERTYNHISKNEWLLNGEKTTLDELLENGVITKSSVGSGTPSSVINIKLNNLVRIGEVTL